MSDIVEGRVVKWLPGTPPRVLIEATLPNLDHALNRKLDRVLVELADGRRLSDEQRKKAFALINEIAEWQGEQPPAVHWLMKIEFKVKHLKSLAKEIFSLSDCDMTTAREYISFLIDFMLRWNVPSKRPLYELCDDVQKYVYACLINKKCAVCGRKAEVHHCEGSHVGMGRNRNTIIHEGLEVMPLCREHHMECHDKGQETFNSLYHLEGMVATKEICQKWGLKCECA